MRSNGSWFRGNMQRVANIIISVGAVGLLALGGYLGFLDKTASATTVLGFAFLLVVLLLLAKFKHVKGFSFEAEMREESRSKPPPIGLIR